MLQTTSGTDLSTTLTNFVTVMVGLSVASERVTETIKQWICPILGKFLNAKAISAVVQMVAVASGMFVAALSQVNPLNLKSPNWVIWVITGLLICGGSAFWNHVLDIIQATKVQKQTAAFGTVAVPPADVQAPLAAAAGAD